MNTQKQHLIDSVNTPDSTAQQQRQQQFNRQHQLNIFDSADNRNSVSFHSGQSNSIGPFNTVGELPNQTPTQNPVLIQQAQQQQLHQQQLHQQQLHSQQLLHQQQLLDPSGFNTGGRMPPTGLPGQFLAHGLASADSRSGSSTPTVLGTESPRTGSGSGGRGGRRKNAASGGPNAKKQKKEAKPSLGINNMNMDTMNGVYPISGLMGGMTGGSGINPLVGQQLSSGSLHPHQYMHQQYIQMRQQFLQNQQQPGKKPNLMSGGSGDLSAGLSSTDSIMARGMVPHQPIPNIIQPQSNNPDPKHNLHKKILQKISKLFKNFNYGI